MSKSKDAQYNCQNNFGRPQILRVLDMGVMLRCNVDGECDKYSQVRCAEAGCMCVLRESGLYGRRIWVGDLYGKKKREENVWGRAKQPFYYGGVIVRQ